VLLLQLKNLFFMSNKLLSRFCTIALFEGISYIFLLGIAMPVKYLAGHPSLVQYGGWVHGVLFIAYVVLLIRLALRDDWKMGRIALAFFASLIPFAPFYLERKLKREDRLSQVAAAKAVENK
jgi:integral membrane protein